MKTPRPVRAGMVPVVAMAATSLQPLARSYVLTPELLAEMVRRGPTWLDQEHGAANAAASAAAKPEVKPGMLLTVTATAERLSCSRNTVFTLIKAGRLPRVLLGRRSARIPECAVAAFAAEQAAGHGKV